MYNYTQRSTHKREATIRFRKYIESKGFVCVETMDYCRQNQDLKLTEKMGTFYPDFIIGTQARYVMVAAQASKAKTSNYAIYLDNYEGLIEWSNFSNKRGVPLWICVCDVNDDFETMSVMDIRELKFFNIKIPVNPKELESTDYLISPEIGSKIHKLECLYQTQVDVIDEKTVNGSKQVFGLFKRFHCISLEKALETYFPRQSEFNFNL